MYIVLNPAYGDMNVQMEKLDEANPFEHFLQTELAYFLLGDDYFDEETGEIMIEKIPFHSLQELEKWISENTDYRVEWKE